ncbi:MAG: hypothetical protein QGG42_14520 [Phycisphaerae bacterium]|jgi:hypothetical protein|nr:hypothetical protein [Phycisphaerae bacterium]
MKQFLSAIAILLLGVTGCASSKAAYRSTATLSPAADAGQYDVAFVIEDISNPGSPVVVSSPRVTLLKGDEACLTLGSEIDGVIWSGIFCTVLVDDAPDKAEARTTVSVWKDGKEVWSENQTVTMSR